MQKYTAANQDDIPFIVQLIENPKYRLFRFGFLKGSTSLFVHDLLHIILEQTMKMSGEAYVIGYTMGSTKKIRKIDIFIFSLFSKYLYPKKFRLKKKDLAIFSQGVKDGQFSKSHNLHSINPTELLHQPLSTIRKALKIDLP